MNLTEEINSLPTGGRGPSQCKACYALEQLPQEDRKVINDALVAGARPVDIAAVMVRYGYDVTSENMSRHHKRGHTK